MKSKNYLALALLLPWSCHKNSKISQVLSEESNVRNVAGPTAYDCGQGTAEFVSFKPLPFAVSAPPVGITLAQFVEISHPEKRDFLKFRLDLCIAPDGAPTLNKIVISIPTFPGNPDSFMEIIPGMDAKITGLSEGLSGEPEKMDITIPVAMTQRVYGLKGMRLPEGSATYFYNGEVENNALVAGNIEAGALEFFNPFSSLDGKICGLGRHLKRKLTLPSPSGAVSLEMELCEIESFGTAQDDFKKVTLIDLGAPEPYRAKEIVISNFTKSELLPYFGWGTSHHNVCTSTLIKLPYGTIGLTNFSRAGNIGGGPGLAGCPAFVDGAPKVEATSNGGASVLVFKYQGKEPVSLIDPKIQYEDTDLDLAAPGTGGGPTF